jgi:sarcosine oxidase subunit beta
LNVRLILASIARFRVLSHAARARGHPFRFRETGSATLVPVGKEERLREQAVLQKREGAEVHVVGSEAASRLPGLGSVNLSDVGAVAWSPRDGWGLPPAYADLVLALAREKGAAVSFNEDAVALDVAGGRARGVRLGGGRALEADAVVVAGGAWTAGVLADAGLPVPLQAYRTQTCLFQGVESPPAILHDALQGMYLRPDEPGRALVGNGTTTRPESPARWKAEADPEFVAASERRLVARVPSARGAVPVASRAGLDSATPDRHPLAGRDPRVEGLHLLVGGNGFGFMRSPALGASLAALVLGRRPPEDLAPFAPARFAGAEKDPFEIREGFVL